MVLRVYRSSFNKKHANTLFIFVPSCLDIQNTLCSQAFVYSAVATHQFSRVVPSDNLKDLLSEIQSLKSVPKS